MSDPSKGDSGPDYLTMKEATEGRLLTVTEATEGGAVPELKVINQAERKHGDPHGLLPGHGSGNSQPHVIGLSEKGIPDATINIGINTWN